MIKEKKVQLKDVIQEGKTSPDLSKIQKWLLTFQTIFELIVWIVDTLEKKKNAKN